MISDVLQLDQLAEALHRANSGVPEWCRRSFYRAKDFLLTHFGTADGRDIQRIDYLCWGCSGSGRHFEEDCYRCDGSGVHHSKLIWLDRFRFGAYSFHRPVSNVTFGPDAKPTIRGKIEHKPYTDSARCAADLAWLFNRDALREEVLQRAQFFGDVPTGEGAGAHAARQWIEEKRLDDAREWKRACEAKVPGVPW